MNIYAFAPIAAALNVAYEFLQGLADALFPLAGANAAALAIVSLTILVRLLLIPVGLSQARAQHTRDRLAPRLLELRRLHGADKERLQRETLGLYKTEGASPLAGCLPLLLQAPVLSVIYGLFVLPVISGHPNELLGHTVFGSALGSSPAALIVQGGSALGIAVPAVLLIVISLVVLLSRWWMLRVAPTAVAPTPALSALTWLPLITVVFAAIVPLAAALYLGASAIWSLSERMLLRRWVHRNG